MKRLLPLALLVLTALAAAQVERGEPLKRSGFLGVQTQAAEGGKGAKVVRLLPGGSGEALKLQVGDILTSVNGAAVATPQHLANAVRGMREGDALKIEYLRKDKPNTVSAKIAPRPKQTETDVDVIYDQVLSLGKRIRVIVNKPKGPGKFPCLLYIGGIGAYTLDASFSSLYVFATSVLQPAVQAGFVTVRIDKPGQGDSEGPVYKDLGFGVEKDAYLQALRLAKTLDFVDKDRIAIFGHSMGGCFGPIVASEEPVKAVIVTGTLIKTWGEYMLENSRRQAELSGMAPDQLDQAERDSIKAVHYLFNEGMSAKEMVEKHPEMVAWQRGNIPDGETYSGVGIPFFRELAQTNLPKAWAGVSADVLAIYCENDFLCGRDDHERIAAAANARRAGSGEFKLLAGSDHLFRKTASQRDSQSTWGQAGTLNPSISETLVEYLKRKLG